MNHTTVSRRSMLPQAPILVLIFALVAVISASYLLSDLLPGIVGEKPGSPLLLGAAILVVPALILLAQWFLAGGDEKPLVFIERFARDCGLARPSRHWAFANPDSVRQLRIYRTITLTILVVLVVILGHACINLVLENYVTSVSPENDSRFQRVVDAPVASVVALVLFGAAIPEEILYRGIPLLGIAIVQRHCVGNKVAALSWAIAILSILVFSYSHHETGIGNMANTAFSGSIYILVALGTRSILIPVVAHALNNLYVYAQWLEWPILG